MAARYTYTLNYSNILQVNSLGTYSKFTDRIVAYTFRPPSADVQVLRIMNTDYNDIQNLDSNIILPHPDDATLPVLNWNTYVPYNNGYVNPFDGVSWIIPTSGIISEYVSRFTFNSKEYFSIFGQIDSSGNFNPNVGLGKNIEMVLSIAQGVNEFFFEQVKIESKPSMQSIKGTSTIPCDTVVTKYPANPGNGAAEGQQYVQVYY